MRMTSLALLALSICLLLPLLAGCGSNNSNPDFRSGVSNLQSALIAYNAAKPSDVTQSGSACRDAAGKLRGLASSLDPTVATSTQRRAATVLHRAYAEALRGFQDCAVGSQLLSYPLMYAADREISQANVWLRRAAQLDKK